MAVKAGVQGFILRREPREHSGEYFIPPGPLFNEVLKKTCLYIRYREFSLGLHVLFFSVVYYGY